MWLEYQNDKVCATFIEFMGREQQDILLKALEQSKLLAYKRMPALMLVMKRLKCFFVLHFDSFATNGKVCVRNKFSAVRHLSSATAQGLYDSFKSAVECMKLDKNDWLWL